MKTLIVLLLISSFVAHIEDIKTIDDDQLYDSYVSYTKHHSGVYVYPEPPQIDTLINDWHIRCKILTNDDLVIYHGTVVCADRSSIIQIKKGDKLLFKTKEYRAKDFDIFDGHPEHYRMSGFRIMSFDDTSVTCEMHIFMPETDWGAIIELKFYEDGTLAWRDVPYSLGDDDF